MESTLSMSFMKVAIQMFIVIKVLIIINHFFSVVLCSYSSGTILIQNFNNTF